MTRPLLVIRPEPGNAVTLAKARALGVDAVGLPLQRVEAVEWNIPQGAFDGLLLGSANVLRLGGAKLDALLDLPVFAVGEHTAQAARERGFTVAATGRGGLHQLLDALPDDQPRHLLRLGGEERVPLFPGKGTEITDCTVYRLVDCDVPPEHLALLENPLCVALHSASAARNFLRICRDLVLEPRNIRIAALGPRIAEAAGQGWDRCEAAPTPDDTALLALAVRLCQ